MIRKIQRRWFEVWADAESQNSVLKYLLLLFAAFCTAELILICALVFKKPLIIAVGSETSTPIEEFKPNANALMREIARAIKKYLGHRHNWDWLSIDAKVKDASNYVASDFREKYLIRSGEQVRIAKEKQVTQKLFSEDPIIDEKEKRALVKTERVLIVSGIHAAQEMIFDIRYSLGARTKENPEGVYIVSDELQNPKPQ